jgi:hypothetical protein
MTGWQEYDRTKDRQRILGKYMIDGGVDPLQALLEGALHHQAGDVVRWRRPCLVGDCKIQFTGVFPLFNATGATLDCKNDLVSNQNAFSTKGLIIIQIIANLATKFPVLLILDVYPGSWISDLNFFHPVSQILDQNFFHPRSLIPDLNFFHPGSWIPDAH